MHSHHRNRSYDNHDVRGASFNADVRHRQKYRIADDKCTGCGRCKRICPMGAIEGEQNKPHMIDPNICIGCGDCYDNCRFDAIEFHGVSLLKRFKRRLKRLLQP